MVALAGDSLPQSPAWLVQAEVGQAGLGWVISSAGDVNGDGYDDVIAGMPGYADGERNEGAAFVYHGSATGLSQSAVWAAELQTSDLGAHFGEAVSGAGDVNGDGYADVLIGGSYFSNDQALEGVAFAYHGSATGLSSSPAWIAESNHARSHFGVSLSSAGDVNADGFDDVIIGMPQYWNAELYEGRMLVYLGSSTGLSVDIGWSVEPDHEQARFGKSVSAAGDVNADGFGDIIVGASGYRSADSGSGAVFGYHGQKINLPPVASDDVATIDENMSATIAVLENDSDPDGDALMVESVADPSDGTAVVNGDGTVAYTPATDFAGSDSFTYTVSDDFGGVDTATVTITVRALNEPPSFTSTPLTSTTVGEQYRYDVTASDADGDALTIGAAQLPAWLELSDRGDGTAVLAGAATEADVGTHGVVLEVSDGEASDTQSFDLAVEPAPVVDVEEDAGGIDAAEPPGTVTSRKVEDGCGCSATAGSPGTDAGRLIPALMIIVALGLMRLVVRSDDASG